ncbi:protein of unknown function [Candidatus Methylocalor cossyra]|uniref:Uncharacterized protein n=1 Tax=Candidatus Methylocalor cossyra TaxID=3108543 RepID=A0ABM9NGX4_9GAMM
MQQVQNHILIISQLGSQFSRFKSFYRCVENRAYLLVEMASC